MELQDKEKGKGKRAKGGRLNSLPPFIPYPVILSLGFYAAFCARALLGVN